MFSQYLGTGITSQPFIKQTYDLVHLAASTGHPYKMRPITAPPYHDPKVSHPDLVRRSGIIPWYLPEVDDTSKVAQVAQTCYHPFTKTPGNCFSSTASPVLKITPVSRTFSNIIYEPHVWLEEVVFLLHTIRLKSYRVQRKKGANSFWFSFILVEFFFAFLRLSVFKMVADI
jgi:hypothetical protein